MKFATIFTTSLLGTAAAFAPSQQAVTRCKFLRKNLLVFTVIGGKLTILF